MNPTKARVLRAVLVDAPLYTAPYDGALTTALLEADVEPLWATRPRRPGEPPEIPEVRTWPMFYRRVEAAAWLTGRAEKIARGAAHLLGLVSLVRGVYRRKPDIVHMQWIVMPFFDLLAILWIRRRFPLILTIHDTTPYNGKKMPWIQRVGFDFPGRLADRVIVHTKAGKEALIRRGFSGSKVSVIQHGPLKLSVPPVIRSGEDDRWTFVLFGELKAYKGLDVLVAAVALMDRGSLEKVRFIVAGRPFIDMATIRTAIQTHKLEQWFDIRPKRLSEDEMATLFAEADCFVFPYRQIDASGVYFLTKGLGKWMIASRVGIFAEEIITSVNGSLVPPEDPQELAIAMAEAIEARHRVDAAPDMSWRAIGRDTRELYEDAIGSRLPLLP